MSWKFDPFLPPHQPTSPEVGFFTPIYPLQPIRRGGAPPLRMAWKRETPGKQGPPPLQIRNGRGDVGIAPYAHHEAAAGRGVEDAAPFCRASYAPVGRGAIPPPPGLVPHSRQGTRALPYKNIVCHPGRTESSAPTKHFVGADDPVAVPKISALPYGGRWKF